MGGAIGTLFLENIKNILKSCINSPMMEINTGSYSENMAYLISKFFIAIGKGKIIFLDKDLSMENIT